MELRDFGKERGKVIEKRCLLCDSDNFASSHHIYGLCNGKETTPLCWTCHILVHTKIEYLCKLLDKLEEIGQQMDIPRLMAYMRCGYKHFSEGEINYVGNHYSK